MVYRYLRTLEGISPPLSLTHLSCQATAKAFVSTCAPRLSAGNHEFANDELVFDRMFSLGIRGSGTDTVPLAGLASRSVATTAGPRRHFLYCTLKGDNIRREKRGQTHAGGAPSS